MSNKMEQVLIATFDPTVFGSKTISEVDAFQSMKFRQATALYAKLAEAHKVLKKPIHIVTAATIRNWEKKNTFPKKDSIYYDPYTGKASTGNCSNVPEKFFEILRNPTSDHSIVRTFKRAKNIAQNEFGAKAETEEFDLPIQEPSDAPSVVTPSRNHQGDFEEIPRTLPADEYNAMCIARAFRKAQMSRVDDWPTSNPPTPIGEKYVPRWPVWSTNLHKWLPEPTLEQCSLYTKICKDAGGEY